MEKAQSMTPRGGVLEEARRIINGTRQDTYGNPEDSFDLIRAYWVTYLKSRGISADSLSAADTMMMMVLFKIAREARQGSVDNVVDGCGYMGLYSDAAYGIPPCSS